MKTTKWLAIPLCLLAGGIQAAEFYVNYNPDQSDGDPLNQNWVLGNAAAQGSVVTENGNKVWFVDGIGQNSSWKYVPAAEDNTTAIASGWTMSWTARIISGNYITNFYGNGSTRFITTLKLLSDGSLDITLGGDATYTLLDANGSADYHDYELAYDPQTQQATFSFDGTAITTWDGAGSSANIISWGNASGSAGKNSEANYRVVSFKTTGAVIDTDGDGVPDDGDAFPYDPAESVDTDGDGLGNNADNDDDADGIVDEQDAAPLDDSIGDDQAPVFATLPVLTIEANSELTELVLETPEVSDNNLNAPVVTSDYAGPLPLGSHEITWTAVDFAGNVATAAQTVNIENNDGVDFNPLPEIVVDAKGLLTNIAGIIAETGGDLVDGDGPVAVDGNSYFRSGKHIVSLLSTDNTGEQHQANINLLVNPLVELSMNQQVTARTTLSVALKLSGQAAVYPVVVDYQLSGNAVAPVASAQVVFESGTEQQLQIVISDQALGGDSVTLTLLDASNAVLTSDASVTFTVTDENVAPQLSYSIEQGGVAVSAIYSQGGAVTVTANIFDINQQDQHDIQWQATDAALTDLVTDQSSTTFEFTPEALTAGRYDLNLTVTETNTTELFALSIDVPLHVVTSLPVLNAENDADGDGIDDVVEGYKDSDQDGIADYLDNDSDVSRLPIGEGALPLQTTNGLKLALGNMVRSVYGAASNNATISSDALSQLAAKSALVEVSSIINFQLSGLQQAGDSVAVIFPFAVDTPVAQDAIYPVYSANSGWMEVAEDANNYFSSALVNSDGNCPLPLSSQYQPGISAGSQCLQLIIQDGGPFDIDGASNGVIENIGVLATEPVNKPPVVAMALQQTVNEGSDVVLDASTTTDADNDVLSFVWSQTAGPSVDLGALDSATLSFVSPQVSADTLLTFSLVVSDEEDSVPVTVELLVTNQNIAPVVTLPTDITSVNEGDTVTITSVVNDVDGDNLTYQWERVSGPDVTIADPQAADATFTAPIVTADKSVELQLTVSDGQAETVQTISFTVINTTPKPKVTKSTEGGAVYWLLMMIGGVMARRRIKHIG